MHANNVIRFLEIQAFFEDMKKLTPDQNNFNVISVKRLINLLKISNYTNSIILMKDLFNVNNV